MSNVIPGTFVRDRVRSFEQFIRVMPVGVLTWIVDVPDDCDYTRMVKKAVADEIARRESLGR